MLPAGSGYPYAQDPGLGNQILDFSWGCRPVFLILIWRGERAGILRNDLAGPNRPSHQEKTEHHQ